MNRFEETIKHEWLLEGLDCANCANKIEHGIGKIKKCTKTVYQFDESIKE